MQDKGRGRREMQEGRDDAVQGSIRPVYGRVNGEFRNVTTSRPGVPGAVRPAAVWYRRLTRQNTWYRAAVSVATGQPGEPGRRPRRFIANEYSTGYKLPKSTYILNGSSK